jgi:pimeloyl-ACP methyl ester carboxylesterase
MTIPLAPADFKLEVEEVTIPADDGLRLSAWLVARAGAPAIVLLHGYPAEKADMLPMAAALARRFTVLLVDLRYFGRSEGRMTTLGLRERGDLRRAIDVLAGRGFDRVGVFGFSLGGAIALGAAAEDPRIRAVAAYSPFADLRALAHELYAWMGPLRYPFVGLMRGWSRLFLGADVTAFPPRAAAARLSIPVYLIASRDDEQIPFRHAERLREALAANPRAEYEFMDRGPHGMLAPDVEQRLERFFLRALEPGTGGS